DLNARTRAPSQNATTRDGGLTCGLARRCGCSVLLAELVDAARRVDDLLLAREERMAVRAHVDLEVFAHGRTRLEGVAAAAGHRDLGVIGMRSCFHGVTCSCAGHLI